MNIDGKTYRLQKKYSNQTQIIDDGRKNWRVAGMSKTQTLPTTASVLTPGAGGATHRQKRPSNAKKTY